MFGLETIRDALINFSAGTPSGQAYLANQREAAQQAQLFPLQLQMAQAQAAKAQQDIETQGLKSKALAGVLSRIGGGGQQQPQQQTPQLSAQELINLSFVDPDTAKSAINALAETRYQQQAAMPKPEVYAIDPNTGNRIVLQPPQQGIQSMLSFGSPAPAPTQTGQIAQALGNMQGRPPVAQEPLAPLANPTANPTGYSPAASDALNADFEAMAAAQTPNTGGVAPVAQVPDTPLPTAYTAGTASPFGEPVVNPKSMQEGSNAAAKVVGQASGERIVAEQGGFTVPAGRAYDGPRALFAAGDTKGAAQEIAKIKDQERKARSSLNSLNTKTKVVSGAIDKALSLAGYKEGKENKDYYFTTGLGGALLQYIPASTANSLKNTLETIKANIGFDALQQMRDNSPTGGALGQVSEKENTLLQSVLGNISLEQKQEDLIANLLQIKDIVEKRGKTFESAITQDFSGVGAAKSEDVIQLDDYMRQQ